MISAQTLSRLSRGKTGAHFSGSGWREQLASLGHSNRTLAEQKLGDRALLVIVGRPERVAGGKPVVDDEPRQQQSARIAAHFMNAPGFPRQRNRARHMIKQAGGATRLGLILPT